MREVKRPVKERFQGSQGKLRTSQEEEISKENQEPSQEEKVSRKTKKKTKTYTCKYCGEGPFTIPKLGTHSKTCPERLEAIAKVEQKLEGKGEVRPPEVVEVAEARQIVAQFGREGLNKIKRERLRSVLDMAPGVSKKSVPWILHKWDVNARLRDDPMEGPLGHNQHGKSSEKPPSPREKQQLPRRDRPFLKTLFPRRLQDYSRRLREDFQRVTSFSKTNSRRTGRTGTFLPWRMAIV